MNMSCNGGPSYSLGLCARATLIFVAFVVLSMALACSTVYVVSASSTTSSELSNGGDTDGQSVSTQNMDTYWFL